MMSRPRLLDLFCCAGGASVGYHRAGFEVVGVDLDGRHRRRYPFEFHQGDALEYVRAHGHEFAAIAASPPCQAYTAANRANRAAGKNPHPDLVAPTRVALAATGRPYIIENVEGAPLLHPLLLCGTEFGLEAVDTDGTPLELRRHRVFESNVYLYGAGGCQHKPVTGHQVGGVYGGGSATITRARTIRHGGYTPATPVRAALLGVDWTMTQYELSQAIPPAYTEHLGRQLLDVIG
jgi:DNA (cytosine-5)-methyltransferase 1